MVSSGGGESSAITLRTFIKRTGGATVATLVAWNLSTSKTNAAQPGNHSHCSAHGSYCTYISAITVTFTSANTNQPPNNTYATSGRRFYGTLKYTSTYCKAGSSPTKQSFPVHSGDHRDPDSAITQGHDTTCPGGTWDATPDSTGKIGFPMDTSSSNPLRTDIEIHGPDTTTGCIAFDNQADFDIFAAEIRCNNTNKCVHTFPNPVPVKVEYAGVTPNWNGPLP